MPPKRIAVIGAGAAGLAQAKQILDAFTSPAGLLQVELVIYEARNDVGGVWLEDPDAGPYRVNANASTNTLRIVPAEPGQLMAYRGSPFDDSIPLFPRAHHVQDYLRSYASSHHLRPFIRFQTTVTRVYKRGASWIIESRHNGSADADAGADEVRVEAYDFCSVTNGHYEKASIPDIPGLAGFSGKIMHSRWYRRPDDFIGKNVLVVGSFASGSDIARELASVNLPSDVLPESMTAHKPPRPADDDDDDEDVPATPHTRIRPTTPRASRLGVYQSSSQTPNMFTPGLSADDAGADDARPWLRLIEQRPLIERIETDHRTPSVIRFNDGSTLRDIDVIIFATGYLYYYPFFKRSDPPWNTPEAQVLDTPIGEEDVVDKGQNDIGGIQGLGMRHMDELMLFLETDRSMAMIGLPYQVVPFPLFEIQSHLVALLWAGRLPHFPDHPTLPSRSPATEPLPTPPETPRESTTPDVPDTESTDDAHPTRKAATAAAATAAPEPEPAVKRYTEKVRGDYVFGFPYEFAYENYLLSLTAEADGGTAGGWGQVEAFRWEYRRQKELRFQTIGY
ncbi:hypothetical protein NliqN6_5422 [Naganishia liquefaciens]|uniref:FAD/NAD(P)-binding domain-containing protein n=1 Tax=Naganishia liquefaciens TaxID=104408 RepID=A0A8H3YGM4_9TREE|nr:hypothetical protein NliqN6_5422 [Naganishia liquefaciens]